MAESIAMPVPPARPWENGAVRRQNYNHDVLAAPVRGNAEFGPYVLDPITSLISFPSFHSCFPELFRRELENGHTVGIAIGDVDDLKRHVERARMKSDLNFGHIAGNEVMTQLGLTALSWFEMIDRSGCLATFGGDEIILAMTDISLTEFHHHVRSLGAILSTTLPCTVSFAHGTFTAENGLASIFSFDRYLEAIVLVDRALFTAKKREGAARVVGLSPRLLSSNGWRVISRKRHT